MAETKIALAGGIESKGKTPKIDNSNELRLQKVYLSL